MKILVLGGGGREHAIVDSLVRAKHDVWCTPGNGGIPTDRTPKDARSITDANAMLALAKQLEADLVVIGPEAPLEAGVADVLRQAGISVFGPGKQAAQLESSKAFAKGIMHKYGIPTARFATCTELDEATVIVNEFCASGTGVVVKPSGLTGGKGVTVCKTREEGLAAVQEILAELRYGDAGATLVIEERMTGQEVSLFAFCDGEHLYPMLPSQDHKRIGDGDTGPNTGGMGAYAPTPFATDAVLDEVKEKILARTQLALLAEGLDYRGILYFGLMLTPDGPKMLEYNCRFGDPETQVVLPLLDGDLGEIMKACADGDLSEQNLKWKQQNACTVVLASEGYPSKYETGKLITGLDEAEGEHVRIYHAGTRREGDRVVSTGGRVLAVTGFGSDLQAARSAAYSAADSIQFDNKVYRKDIGHHALNSNG